MFATGTADRKFCIFEENRHCARNAAHPTSENGKLAALTSGRPAFQQHKEHAEGSDTSHVSHTRKDPERMAYKPQFRQKKKDHAAQRGRDACGTATRISASLFRRLSVSFRSASDQDPKGAKYAVLPSGHAGFPECAQRSEGRDSASIQSTLVSPCEPLCAIFLREPRCVPTFTCESKRGPFVREVENRNKERFETALWR